VCSSDLIIARPVKTNANWTAVRWGIFVSMKTVHRNIAPSAVLPVIKIWIIIGAMAL